MVAVTYSSSIAAYRKHYATTIHLMNRSRTLLTNTRLRTPTPPQNRYIPINAPPFSPLATVVRPTHTSSACVWYTRSVGFRGEDVRGRVRTAVLRRGGGIVSVLVGG